MSDERSFFSELRRRRVFQTGAGYVVAALALWGGIDFAAEAFAWPDRVLRVVVILSIAGLPIALLCAWLFEVRREDSVEHADGSRPTRGARWIRIGVVLVSVAAIAGLATYLLYPASAEHQQLAAGNGRYRLAVLYFKDLDTDSALAHVADGLTEDLIRELSSVPALQVAPRGDVELLRGTDLPPDSVARLLDATSLVEGSVQQVDTLVRVELQLVDGATGDHIMRSTLERRLSDVLDLRQAVVLEAARIIRNGIGLDLQLREWKTSAPSTSLWLRLGVANQSFLDAGDMFRRNDTVRAEARLAQADNELRAICEEAPAWTEPMVLRGRIAYERSRFSTTQGAALAHADTAAALADDALALEPQDAAALELRGTAKYWAYLLTSGSGASDSLRSNARADLERAVKLDPSRASAYAVLSHLYMYVGAMSKAVAAAKHAYETPISLSHAADAVLFRLTAASYDLGDYDGAKRWCDEGHRRFPEDFRFVDCQIVQMTMPGAVPDVDKAWRLYQQAVRLLPGEIERHGGSELFLDARMRMDVGGIIGLAGLRDSADAVMTGARLGPKVDPRGELKGVEASMRALMGDKQGAITMLRQYVASNPGSFNVPENSKLPWWWNNLKGDQEFDQIRTGH